MFVRFIFYTKQIQIREIHFLSVIRSAMELDREAAAFGHTKWKQILIEMKRQKMKR